MRADTEGRVSAPTRVVSMGGNINTVAVFGEDLPENKSSVLADGGWREALMMESSWRFASSSSGSCSSESPALVHLSMRMSSIVAGVDSRAKACGADEKKENEKKESEGVAADSHTTGSLAGCLDKGHLAQTHGVPCNRVTVGMGEVGGFEDCQESGMAGLTRCTEVDQPDLVHGVHGEDSFANTAARVTRSEFGQGRERKLPKFCGVYINGLLNGLEVTYTVDGAATDTLIASWIYEQLPEDVRPKLQPETGSMTSGAGGGPIQILGKAKFELQLGPEKLIREVRVAEIKDEILLGDDIIRRDPEGPMDIINSQKVIKFKGREIPMVTVGLPKRALRVSTIDEEVIPGMTEKIVDVFIKRPDETYDVDIEESMLVEADEEFIAVNRCIVAPVVIRAIGRVTAQVRLFNPFAEPALLKGEQVLGELVPVEVERILKEEEHPEERENQNSTRRVQVQRRSPRLIKRLIRQARQEQRESTPHEDGSTLLAHLQGLFERSSEGWTVDEQKTIRRLLIQYQDVFSKSEFDLG